jgi:hypothetical protein
MLCSVFVLGKLTFRFDSDSSRYYEGVMFNRVLTLLTIILSSSLAFGEAFEGQVSIVNGQAMLIADGATDSWKIQGTSDQVISQLNTLQDGDYLSATGELNEAHQTAFVETVDFVGLKRILGRWVSKDGYSINFIDFRTAVVEQKQDLPWDPAGKKVDLVYAMLPLKEQNWSLFMSNRKTVRIGTLSIEEKAKVKALSIQLVDQRTGQITEDISLSPSADPQ